MINFTVIGGYLGAGKTTLLNRILCGDHGIRFALLINDFGEINIDAGLIESETDSQINLTNGCVCCTLTDGFHEAIDELCNLEPKPEHIIIEASGVADIGNLAQYGYAPELMLDGILVLADAETLVAKANDKYVASTVRRQLQAADLIILNKIDLISGETLQARRAWLQENLDKPRVIECCNGDVPLSLLLGVHIRSKTNPIGHAPHETYATWSYQSAQDVTREQLEQFAEHLPSGIVRAKGFARSGDDCLALQVVGRRKEVSAINSDQQGLTLVAIALEQDLEKQVLDELAASVFNPELLRDGSQN